MAREKFKMMASGYSNNLAKTPIVAVVKISFF